MDKSTGGAGPGTSTVAAPAPAPSSSTHTNRRRDTARCDYGVRRCKAVQNQAGEDEAGVGGQEPGLKCSFAGGSTSQPFGSFGAPSTGHGTITSTWTVKHSELITDFAASLPPRPLQRGHGLVLSRDCRRCPDHRCRLPGVLDRDVVHDVVWRIHDQLWQHPCSLDLDPISVHVQIWFRGLGRQRGRDLQAH